MQFRCGRCGQRKGLRAVYLVVRHPDFTDGYRLFLCRPCALAERERFLELGGEFLVDIQHDDPADAGSSD